MGQVSRAAEISQLLDPQVEKAYSQGLADHLKRSREAECQSSWIGDGAVTGLVTHVQYGCWRAGETKHEP